MDTVGDVGYVGALQAVLTERDDLALLTTYKFWCYKYILLVW